MSAKNHLFTLSSIQNSIQNNTISKVFIEKGHRNLPPQFQKILQENNIPVSFVPIEKLHRLSKGKPHDGVIAAISPVPFESLENLVEQTLEKKEKPLFLILDQITDSRNFGAIIRTAECTGVDGIIFQSHGSATVNADTIHTSTGAVYKVPLCRVSHIKDALFYLQSSGIETVGATEKSNATIYDVNLNKALALIMGAEDKGISPSILKMLDNKAKLPMLGDIESLNVSVACGAVLYEITRQRIAKN